MLPAHSRFNIVVGLGKIEKKIRIVRCRDIFSVALSAPIYQCWPMVQFKFVGIEFRAKRAKEYFQ